MNISRLKTEDHVVLRAKLFELNFEIQRMLQHSYG